jgi:signal transduction histidine kinase
MLLEAMPNDIKYYFTSFFIAFLLLGLFIILLATLYSKKQQRNKAEKMRMQSEFNETLLQTQLEIQEQTLKNISEEIHDNIGQVLSVVKLNLNTFPDDLEPEIKSRITDTEVLLSKAIDDLRDLSQSMHGDNIASIGLQGALEMELKHLQKTGKFNTRLQVGGNRLNLPAQKEMVLFRIVQEALNNVVKHAAAKNIEIELLYSPSSLILQVTDDGKGFEPEQQKNAAPGIGLKSMYNRAALIGGCFLVHSTPGNGTTIKIEITT